VSAQVVGRRTFEKALTSARDEIEWFFTVRVSELDLSAISYESKDSHVWDDSRISMLHDRELSKLKQVARARRIAHALAVLPRELQLAARARWQSFPAQLSIVSSAFRADGESGTYLGVVLILDAAKRALDAELEKSNGASPRTVLEMLQQWARAASSARKIEPLRRDAVRTYARVVHEYAHAALEARGVRKNDDSA
jgi:hypothetical protein